MEQRSRPWRRKGRGAYTLVVPVVLSRELLDEIDEEADRREVNRSQVIREAVLHYLQHLRRSEGGDENDRVGSVGKDAA